MKRHLPLAAILVIAFASVCFAQPHRRRHPQAKAGDDEGPNAEEAFGHGNQVMGSLEE